MKYFDATLTQTEQKGLGKHYVYNGPVMSISGAAKPYKALVKYIPGSAEMESAIPYKTHSLLSNLRDPPQKELQKHAKTVCLQ